MPTIAVQARVKKELKEEAEEILDAMGLTLSDGVRLFLQQVVNTGSLPFQPTIKQPNAETIAAMNELERGGGQRAKSVKAMFAQLDAAE